MKEILNKKQLFFLVHAVTFFCIYFILYKLNVISVLPGNKNLIIFDAGWYKTIVDNGYIVAENDQSNIAFFPLFPFLWKFLGLCAVGISIFNLSVFLIGFYILINSLKINNLDSLLLISTPSLFFCFVPYTEAMFFLFTSLLLTGLIKKSLWLTLAGLFFASLTRSVAMIFIPALVFIELINCSMKKESIIKLIKNVSLYLIVVLSSILIVAIIQWYYTGNWFGFIGAQQYWGNTLKIPVLPFTTASIKYILWLDGSALLVGILSLTLLLIFFFRWIITGFTFTLNKEIGFSLAYLSLVSLVVVFTRMLSESGQTTIYSLNRYIFGTSFFIIFLAYSKENFQKIKYNLFLLGASVTVILVLVGLHKIFSTGNTSFPINLLFLVFYVSAYIYIFSNHKKFYKISRIGMYILNTIIQAILLSFFLNVQFLG